MLLAPRAFLHSLFDAAVAAAQPGPAVAANLPPRPRGRTIVIGAGKASAQMARAFEQAWDGPIEGLVVTRYGYACPCERIEIVEAAHPVPDASGLAAAARLKKLMSGLTADDLVVALISGGGSALLPAPADGLTLADEIALNEALLASGAPIGAMNAVRKQISTIKGGRLAALAAPARVVSLVISDVPGDDPSAVASGPTVPDETTRQEARDIVARYRMALPPTVGALIAGDANLPPHPNDGVFARNEVKVIASAARSLEAAAEVAAQHGVAAAILSDAIEGEARDVGQVHAALAREVALRDRPFKKPVVMISGGETTVTLRGKGRGGRNTEFLLALALNIEGQAGIHAIAGDTDGIDGSEDNAGGFVDATTADRLRAAGRDPQALLADNDAWSAFSAIGDLLVTGPTGTNVNDFRAVLVV